MTREEFKILHSELIMYCQCIEFDLKRIYAGMSDDKFSESMDMLETSNLGRTLIELKKLDYSDGVLDLPAEGYELLNNIREIRNYWCHQCYLDYIYINDEVKKEKTFLHVAERLLKEHKFFAKIHEDLENFYIHNYS